ncbi:MAG TPA: hypothetical protein PKU97_12360 [Kofleriaceae bacterium]|nr:hypothetical protein [Kofleriaceae bacterium]
MSMHFEELDKVTRSFMLREFDAEEARGNPYRSAVLSPKGLAAYAATMRAALASGSEVDVQRAFAYEHYWNPTETYNKPRGGGLATRAVNFHQASERLGLTEFNTWYVRGFAARLLSENETMCEVYRASEPKFTHASCSTHEGQRYPVRDIYDGHRAGYWPPGNTRAGVSIPAGPGCHHTIRRVR